MKVAHRARMRAKLSMAPATRAKVAFGEMFGRRVRWLGFDLAAAPDETTYFRGRGSLQLTGRADMEFLRQMEIERRRTPVRPVGSERRATLVDFNFTPPARGVTIPPGHRLSIMGPNGEWLPLGTTT